MNITDIVNLLPLLQSAISFQSWEDAQDVASEIARLCRKRLEELQTIQEALLVPGKTSLASLASLLVNQEAKTPGAGISAPNSPPTDFNSEIAYCNKVTAKELLEALRKPPKANRAIFAKEPPYRPEPGITLDTRFDEIGHVEPWRNEVANELNALLAYMCGYVSDGEPYTKAAISIVSRVAEFEQIQVRHE